VVKGVHSPGEKENGKTEAGAGQTSHETWYRTRREGTAGGCAHNEPAGCQRPPTSKKQVTGAASFLNRQLPSKKRRDPQREIAGKRKGRDNVDGKLQGAGETSPGRQLYRRAGDSRRRAKKDTQGPGPAGKKGWGLLTKTNVAESTLPPVANGTKNTVKRGNWRVRGEKAGIRHQRTPSPSNKSLEGRGGEHLVVCNSVKPLICWTDGPFSLAGAW